MITMSNQCTNLFNNRSFTIPPLKPHCNILCLISRFRNNRVSISRKSRSKKCVLPVATHSSSSDIVLIDTTVNRDGSFVFRFGDASEVVKKDEVLENDEVVEEIEGRVEGENNVVNVLDGDQVRQVTVKIVERGYRTSEGRLAEVAVGISNANIISNGSESLTSVITDLSDYQEESSDGFLDNIGEEVLLSPSDAENDYLEGVESTDKTEYSTQPDEDENSDPIISVLDNSQNVDKGADPEGTLLQDSEDEHADPSESVKLESSELTQTEVMDVKESYAGVELEKVESDQDTSQSYYKDLAPPSTPVTLDVSDLELTAAANEEEELQVKNITEAAPIDEIQPSDPLDVELTDAAIEVGEEELQDTSIIEAALIDEMPPSNPYNVELEDAANEVVEEDLQDTNITESALIDEMIPSDPLDVEVKDTANEAAEEEVQHMKIDEGTLVDEMLPSEPFEVELTIGTNEDVEEELQDMNNTEGSLIDEIQPSDPLDVVITDAANEDVEEELQDMSLNESSLKNEKPPSDPLDAELTVSANEDVEEELQVINISEGTLKDELTSSDTVDVELTDDSIEDVEEKLQDMIINEATLKDEMPPSNPFEVELTSEEADTTAENSSAKAEDPFIEDELQQVNTSNIDENGISPVIPVTSIEEAEPIVEEEVSLPSSTPLELKTTMQVSDVGVEDIMPQNLDDGILRVHDESEDPSVSVKLETMQVSHIEIMDVTQLNAEDELQKVETVDASEGDTDDLLPPAVLEKESSEPQSTPLALLEPEPTMQVSDIKVEETIGPNLDDEVLQVAGESENPTAPVDLETMHISNIEVIDLTQPTAKEELQNVETEDINELDTEDFLSPATMHVSGVELRDSTNEDMEEGSQDMNISEGTFIDEMPPSDPLGAGATLDVKDQDIGDEFQQLTIDNGVENDVANVMTSEPIREEEADQKQSIPVEVTPTIQFSDMEVQDATDQNQEDEILQITEEVAGDSYIMDGKQSHQIEAQTVQDEVVIQNIVEESAETDELGGSILLTESVDGPVLEAERTVDNVSSDEVSELSEDMDLLLATEAEIEWEDIYPTGDFLSSGAALLEHPNKALTGGDDACFVAGSRWLGVANGVSQWSFEGTNPGAYAKELMRTCEDIVLDTSNVPVTNPVELLCRGVKETSMSGSSNILIANFDGQALHVANIGDTGFLILRHGAIYKKSSPLLHEFHFALHVEDSDDPLQLVEEHTIELEEGDIVVSATDGLFDNLYEREIAMIVSKSLQAGIKPKEIANILATRAQEVGRSTSVRSPFSDAAQTAGYTSYAGGKPDNVAVIVSLVERISNSLAE
ncbi:PPM-type phosphatase domain-containing protein [Artemisia annua]|uniref:PPM-type phosphatase domain-containing protein n=1 Tax=Artemisia annua TaxID=35608 RepID=A0A2U1QK11_ARTAN|nr:PPM-type phosphatase domain-containing protein [Artemisia annua]